MAHPVLSSAAWMGGTLISFVAMAVAARELSADLGTFQILAIRSLIGFLGIAVILSQTGWQQISLRNLNVHILRNLAHFCGQFGWFYAIAFIPLVAVFAIEFTVPIWTALFAAILLAERLSAVRLLAIVLGILGVLIILRPGLAVVHPAALAMLGGAVAYGLSHVLTKKLSGQDSSLCILFYMTLIQLPMGLLPAAFAWTTPTATHWPWLILVGVSGLTAHYCMVRALSLADAMLVVPMDFLRLPLIALVGYAFYGEHIDGYLAMGAGLIIAANLINVLWERKKERLVSSTGAIKL